MKLIQVVSICFLLLGCEPSFDTATCMGQCEQCEGIPCEAVCAELKEGFESFSCRDESQAVWTCALAHECYFPTACEPEVAAFLECR